MTIQVIVNTAGKLPEAHFVECEDFLSFSEAITIAEETITNQLFLDGTEFQSVQSSVL